MRVDVSVDFSRTAVKAGNDRAVKRAVTGTAREFRRLADPYVPFLTGTMARSADFSPFERGEVVYDTPYARHIYYAPEGTHLTRNKHPNAQLRWGEVVKSQYSRQLLRTFEHLLKGGI